MKTFLSKKGNILRKAAVLAAAFILTASAFFTCDLAQGDLYAEAETDTAGTVIAENGLNVRIGPGTSYTLIPEAGQPCGARLTIYATLQDANGEDWYYILTPNGYYGYVKSSFVHVMSEQGSYQYDYDFESQLASFPESYRPYLRDLHNKYPEWVFVPELTGLDWNTVIAKESKIGTSLISSSRISEWKSHEPGAYNESTGKFVSFDSGGWNAASEGIIKYYMDPRNFINNIGIFQFLTHSYDANTQTEQGLSRVLANTFMSGAISTPEEGFDTYAQVIMQAGMTSGVNPYVLASMILIEQGVNGTGGCISGTASGYEGIYNFYNIGAYKTSSMSAVTRGLWYASQSGSYGRPWDTRFKAIVNGALFYFNNYVSVGKDTLYFKKWNVKNGIENVGTGQYMSNVEGASLEASKLRNGYSSSMDMPIMFVIPVYENMPETACELPVKYEEPASHENTEQEENAKIEQEKLEEERRLALEALNNDIKASVEAAGLTVRSKITSKGIRIDWTKSDGADVDYYEVFRSNAKYSGYTNTPYYVTSDNSKTYYVNTKNLKKGKVYYYKVRGVRTLTDYDGNQTKVYTKASKAWRTYK